MTYYLKLTKNFEKYFHVIVKLEKFPISKKTVPADLSSFLSIPEDRLDPTRNNRGKNPRLTRSFGSGNRSPLIITLKDPRTVDSRDSKSNQIGFRAIRTKNKILKIELKRVKRPYF